MVVVGVGLDPGLHRMIDFLGQTYNVPIRAVTFDVFDLEHGERVIVREETEPETTVVQSEVAKLTAAGVIEASGGPDSPMGRHLLSIVQAGERGGSMYARPYKRSFMLTPQQNKSRGLIVMGRWLGGDKLQISHDPEAIAEFFPIVADEVIALLGPGHVTSEITSDADAEHWVARLDALVAAIAAAGEQEA